MVDEADRDMFIGVDRDIRRRCFTAYISDGRSPYDFVSGLVWEHSPTGVNVPQFSLCDAAAQGLMNDLYLAGLRPTCVAYDEEKKALSAHLDDMRGIVNHFLKMGLSQGLEAEDVLHGVRLIRR